MVECEKPFTPRDGVDLREHLEARIDDLRKFYDTRIATLETTIDKASLQMDKRLDGMNEFREALKDAQGQMATRTELSSTEKDIAAVKANVANCVMREVCENHMQSIEASVNTLREFKAALEGKASYNSVLIAMIMSAIGLAVSIMRLFMQAGS